MSVLTHVKIEGVQFLHQEGKHQNLLDLVVMVYDEHEKHVEGFEKNVELNLIESSYRTMLQLGFTSRTDVELPAGHYRIKAIVREGNQAKMGSLEETVEVPPPESKASSPGSMAKAEGVEVDQLFVPESGSEADPADADSAEADPILSFAPVGLENGDLVLSQQLIPLADLSADEQQSLLEDGESVTFKDTLILPPIDDQIDRHYPVTIFYRLYNLKYPEESESMTAQIQLADESGRVSRFPPIPLGQGNTQSRQSGTVDVAFDLSLENVQPGRYKLTLMTGTPAAGGQSVGLQTTIMVVE